MIRITYEYVCDICRLPAGPTDTYSMMPTGVHYVTPQPRIDRMVGSWTVCGRCMDLASRVLVMHAKRLELEKQIADAQKEPV